MLVELHGGTLDVESQVGRGTTVRIRLPEERVMPPGLIDLDCVNDTAF
jgi:signal transduction histidine kinase